MTLMKNLFLFNSIFIGSSNLDKIKEVLTHLESRLAKILLSSIPISFIVGFISDSIPEEMWSQASSSLDYLIYILYDI